jgi:hypothetical protein
MPEFYRVGPTARTRPPARRNLPGPPARQQAARPQPTHRPPGPSPRTGSGAAPAHAQAARPQPTHRQPGPSPRTGSPAPAHAQAARPQPTYGPPDRLRFRSGRFSPAGSTPLFAHAPPPATGRPRHSARPGHKPPPATGRPPATVHAPAACRPPQQAAPATVHAPATSRPRHKPPRPQAVPRRSPGRRSAVRPTSLPGTPGWAHGDRRIRRCPVYPGT